MNNPTINPVPKNTLMACTLPGLAGDVTQFIRPCEPNRQWMDDSAHKYAYRCIPLLAANTMGWEILNPVDAALRWNGGQTNLDLTVKMEGQHPFGASSHFGSGVATWYLPFLFRTPPDMGLVVTGPANNDRNDAVALEAFVRTDWLPFPFTMNWRVTTPDADVTFKAGEPICRVFPFPIALLEETTLEISKVEDDPAFAARLNEFAAARQQNVQKQQQDMARWAAGGKAPEGEGVWNSQYVRATRQSQGEGYAPHQTVFKCMPPEDKRS